MTLPTPTALQVLRGNPSHRPLNLNEPRPDAPPQEPPDYLDPVGCEEWERIFPELHRLGLATLVDRSALAAYCQAFSDWRWATEQVEQHGRTVETPNGLIQTSPYVTQARQARADMLRIGAAFGFTPSSRTKLSSPPVGDREPADLLT